MSDNITNFDTLPFVEKYNTVENVINQEIKPMLAGDGGSLEIVDIRENEGFVDIYINYLGACQGCPASRTGTLYAIQAYLNQRISDKIRVFPV